MFSKGFGVSVIFYIILMGIQIADYQMQPNGFLPQANGMFYDVALSITRFVRKRFFGFFLPFLGLLSCYYFFEIRGQPEEIKAKRIRFATFILQATTSILSLMFVFKNMPDFRHPKDFEIGVRSAIGNVEYDYQATKNPTDGPAKILVSGLMRSAKKNINPLSGLFK